MTTTIPVNLLHTAFVQTLATYLSVPEGIRGTLLCPDTAVLYDWMVDHGISTESLPTDWFQERALFGKDFEEPATNLQQWFIWDAYMRVLEACQTRTDTEKLTLVQNWLRNPQDKQNEYAISDAFEGRQDNFHMDLTNAIRFPNQVWYFCTSACHCRTEDRDEDCSNQAKLRYHMLNRLDGPKHGYLPPVPPVWVP